MSDVKITPEQRAELPKPEDYRVSDLPDDQDIVFGKGPITEDTVRNFILDYPDSVLKFLQRKDLDERPLPFDFENVYSMWRDRGLRKDILELYFLHFMDWPNGIPEGTMLDLLSDCRDRIKSFKK
jgi:hypothetical protein